MLVYAKAIMVGYQDKYCLLRIESFVWLPTCLIPVKRCAGTFSIRQSSTVVVAFWLPGQDSRTITSDTNPPLPADEKPI